MDLIGAEPKSLLTLQRPDIWQRGLKVASRITGFEYPSKPQRADGQIYDATVYQADGSGFDTERKMVFVPEGAMEWLLHEIGHWLAASGARRDRHDYGLPTLSAELANADELRALAFEEIVFAPFGPARSLVPPHARDVQAFDLSGPLPADVLGAAERSMAEARVDVLELRHVWGEWVEWGRGLGHRAPWLAER